MRLGIVGLPYSGKTSLFNALTSNEGGISSFQGKNIGIVSVYDERLPVLEGIYKSKKTIFAQVEFIDIPSEGNIKKNLPHIREADGIVQVINCFDDLADPGAAIDELNSELIYADLEAIQKRIDKFAKENKSKKITNNNLEILEKIQENLMNEVPARNIAFSEDEIDFAKELFLLTLKPMLYIANVDEDGILGNEFSGIVQEIASAQNSECFIICAKIEEELSGLSDDEKLEMLDALGIGESAIKLLTKGAYKALSLMSFLTAGEKEVRAWTIPINTKALHAAGKIHSDIERGFIRAQVFNYDDLIEHKTEQALKEKGLIRLEGKEYIVAENDIILFRFNV